MNPYLDQGPKFADTPGRDKPIFRERNKAKLPKDNEKVIGVVDPSFRYISDQGANTGFGLDIFDTTTHGDRAIYQLHNTSGGTRYINDHAIYGKPVLQIAGQGGFLWEYSDFDDIDTNGELFKEISNKFIIDPLQCEAIGDWAWKRYAPHKAYDFAINGTHPEIEPGSVWSLTINHSLAGNTIEAINCDIEVKSVSMSRSVGEIGMTEIVGVIYDGAWSKTNSTRTRMVGGGRPQWMQNRSNTIVVASADYVGQADYYCDGTDDDVQIQDAIDRLTEIGGGTVILTEGEYTISASIVLGNNIIINGAGSNTIIYENGLTSQAVANVYPYFASIDKTAVSIRNICIDGQSDSYTLPGATYSLCGIFIYSSDADSTASVYNVEVKRLSTNYENVGILLTYTAGWQTCQNCIIHDNVSSSGNCAGIAYSENTKSNYIYNMTASAAGAYGILQSKQCHGNKVGSLTGSSTAKYYQSYADSAGSGTYACADTANGGFNS